MLENYIPDITPREKYEHAFRAIRRNILRASLDHYIYLSQGEHWEYAWKSYYARSHTDYLSLPLRLRWIMYHDFGFKKFGILKPVYDFELQRAAREAQYSSPGR